MQQQEDQYFIDKVLAGESSAFAVLVDRHKNNVFNICIKILQNREDAEEVAQDVFIKLFDKLKTFRSDAKLSTWIFRIAYNMSISRQRKRKRHHVEIDERAMADADEEESLNRLHLESVVERERKLKTAIEKLDGPHQLVLQLFYEKEMSIIDIAKVTGISESNVRVKMHRARKRLFTLMDDATIHQENSV